VTTAELKWCYVLIPKSSPNKSIWAFWDFNYQKWKLQL